MFSKVLQHVDECVTHLARCRERPRVISAGPHIPAPSEHAVDGLRDADSEALKPSLERGVSIAFDEQMDVVGLHAELEQAKRRLRCPLERSSHCAEDVLAP